MRPVGHARHAQGRSVFRVFAPGKASLVIVLAEGGERFALQPEEDGHWQGAVPALPAGTLYWIEVDGRCLPDPASRCQPQGVHGPSMVVDVEPVRSPGWTGVRIGDAIVYELHLGSFTPQGTLAAAGEKLPHLRDLGITVIELLPIAAFPGERNWGYDGTFLFALHAAYGDYRDLKAFIEAAHTLGMAVVLDVVYNHFGPEGNYSGAFAPYAKAAATPWGAAINFDGEWNHGVRAFFLANARHWLQEVGFDGFRMDAVSMIFDNMPVHILRECTDLARAIGREECRDVIMIVEHLRNNRFVTAREGFGFQAQWNDDLNHAIFAFLSGETQRHYANFGSFDDVVRALASGFVLGGTRLDRHHHYFLGTDAADTQGCEHVVHIQNHDQIGNRLLGDRMIASYGPAKALLGITAVMASPFVPMIFMGEEYGETAPFLFHEDFSEQVIIDGAREGRKADFAYGGVEPPDPHDRATFEASKLQWSLVDTPAGRRIFGYYQQLIALKRRGELGPRQRAKVVVTADRQRQLIRIESPHTLTVMNFSADAHAVPDEAGWEPLLRSFEPAAGAALPAYGALILKRVR
jgi:maltooligosyltrehalose trehalohydrolase